MPGRSYLQRVAGGRVTASIAPPRLLYRPEPTTTALGVQEVTAPAAPPMAAPVQPGPTPTSLPREQPGPTLTAPLVHHRPTPTAGPAPIIAGPAVSVEPASPTPVAPRVPPVPPTPVVIRVPPTSTTEISPRFPTITPSEPPSRAATTVVEKVIRQETPITAPPRATDANEPALQQVAGGHAPAAIAAGATTPPRLFERPRSTTVESGVRDVTAAVSSTVAPVQPGPPPVGMPRAQPSPTPAADPAWFIAGPAAVVVPASPAPIASRVPPVSPRVPAPPPTPVVTRVPPAATTENSPRFPTLTPSEPSARAARNVAERVIRPAEAATAPRGATDANDPSSLPPPAVKRGRVPSPVRPPTPTPGQPQWGEPQQPIVVDAQPTPALPRARPVEAVRDHASTRVREAGERPPTTTRLAPPIRLEPPAVVPAPRLADESGGRGVVRIGSLEVRILPPLDTPAAAGRPPVQPVRAARPVGVPTAPLSRGFRSFGLSQG
jgi:hypothetical protein